MAWYDTGTVSVTNGSTTVTGAGTNFIAGAQIGEAFYGPDDNLYEIESITSTTVLVLADPYLGATQSGQDYKIVPTQSLVADLAGQVTTLINDFQTVADEAGEGKFDDGSATTPGITFTQDQDTGFFRETANEIGISVGGSKIGEFSSTGLNGTVIGGTTPAAVSGTTGDFSGDLTVSGKGTFQGASPNIVFLETDTTDTNARLRVQSGDLLFETTDDAGGQVSENMRIDSSGNVGIGTSSPDYELHVANTATSAHVLIEADSASESRLWFGDADSNVIGRIEYSHGFDYMNFFTNGSEAMRIDSSGNVGIGTSSPLYKLQVEDANSRLVSTSTSATSYASTEVRNELNSSLVNIIRGSTATGTTLGQPNANGAQLYSISADYLAIGTFQSNPLILGTSNAEAMRIDSSGNLLVGTTTSPAGGSFEGIKVSDATSVGDSRSGVYFGLNGVYPAVDLDLADNSIDLGNAFYRWDDIYATNGTIQTSDRNEKQDIEELSDAEQRVAVAAKGLLRKYRWKDAVAEKGDAARIHFGIIAQDLQAAFEAEGLDAGRYGMFISSTWWEATETYTDDDGVEQTRTVTYGTAEEAPEGATERTRMGVRYPELLAFIIGAM